MHLNSQTICEATEKAFGLQKGSLQAEDRQHEIARARQAYFVVALYFNITISHAAERVSRHHSTAYHSITKALQLCMQNREYLHTVLTLINELKEYEKTEKTSSRTALYRCAVDAIL